MATLVYYIAAIGSFLSASLVFPALVAFGFSETEIGFRVLMYALFGGFVFAAILLSATGTDDGISRNQTIVLAIFSWIFFPAVYCIPIADMTGSGIVDAVFQSYSSFTTTGAVVFDNIEQVPKSVMFMLAQFQWLGGYATLITLILVLAPWRIGGLPQIAEVSIAASIVATHQRLGRFCLDIFQVYTLMTVICFACLMLIGVNPYDASILSFSALSTGGILPGTAPLDGLLGAGGLLVLSFFLFIGATSVFWHSDIGRLHFPELFRHRESYYILGSILALGMYISYTLLKLAGSTAVLSPTMAFAEGLFNATSIVSTSGMQSRPGVLSVLPHILVLMLVFIGGGCFSTAGGIKHFRIGGIYHYANVELNRLIFPSLVGRDRFGATKYDSEFIKALWAILSVLIAVLGIVTILLSVSGLEFQQAFTAALAAITNSGPVYGPFWGSGAAEDWPTYGQLPDFHKVLMTLTMVLGRLEVIAVFASVFVLTRSVVAQVR